MFLPDARILKITCFSALQRAEIAEIASTLPHPAPVVKRFSALQRAEIAEIWLNHAQPVKTESVSVLFNEPKLLKFNGQSLVYGDTLAFQCSSTSRNC